MLLLLVCAFCSCFLTEERSKGASDTIMGQSYRKGEDVVLNAFFKLISMHICSCISIVNYALYHPPKSPLYTTTVTFPTGASSQFYLLYSSLFIYSKVPAHKSHFV